MVTKHIDRHIFMAAIIFVSICILWSFVAYLGVRNDFGLEFVTSLFTALAFAGVIYQLHLQRKEIESQSTEIKEQKEALNDLIDVLKKTAQVSIIPTLIRTASSEVRDSQASIKPIRQDHFTGFHTLDINALSDILDNPSIGGLEKILKEIMTQQRNEQLNTALDVIKAAHLERMKKPIENLLAILRYAQDLSVKLK